jgi:predicted CXXCH cytochrome family protein
MNTLASRRPPVRPSDVARLAAIAASTLVALAAGGCVHETSAPPAGPGPASSFVGYSDPATQQTTCGNCHPLNQQAWIKTGHARAWADLQASGQAAASCDRCHTTNGTSNVGADSGGFLGVSGAAQRYFQDVQCEACHGPGAAHITIPDETQPIPYLVSYDPTLHVGCGTCHSGAPHASFYEDWSHGAHRLLEGPAISNGGACLQCHEGRTVAQRFGGSDVFVEVASATPMPIGCASCHNPHGSDSTAELREPISTRDTTNLCIRCHQRNAAPDTANTRGPHSPQGPTLLGKSGWIPPGFVWDSTNIPTHANATANPRLCVTCHVDTLDVAGAGGTLAWHYTGHGFYAIPCVDAAGVDSTDSCDLSLRSFAACARSGCHSSGDAARTNFQGLEQVMAFLAGTLWTDVNGNGKIDAGDTGLLTQVPATEFTRDSIITVAEGALFNAQLVNVDGSHGVHNPPYLKALLTATIQAVQQRYGLAAPARASWRSGAAVMPR